MKKIILIEDNLDIRETTQEILELADYEVYSAENGKEGVKLAKEKNPDLIICDVMMPELDGYGVLRILCKNPITSNIPFIFLTAKTEKADIRKGMNLGADDYITKPFDESELLEAIETRLQRSDNLKKSNENNIEGLNEFINEARGIEELKDLSKDRKIKSYRKKEVIYREDDYANFLYFIISGEVKCFNTDSYGKDFVNDIYTDGEFFGYLNLLEEGEYHETALTMAPTEVAVIPKSEFQVLINKNIEVATNFIKLLTGNLRDREERMLKLAYAPLRERVADTLIKLISKTNEEDCTLVKLKISREDLASMIGTAKESLTRTLSELKKEGIIDTEGQEIKVLNEAELKKAGSGL